MNITDIISKYNDIINDFIWGPPMMILLMGAGLYFTVRLGFFQVTKLKFIWENTIKKMFKDSEGNGDISSGQAALVGLAGIVGSGNIAGVATAVASGGPGALFWMWIAGFFGMGTKFAEISLGLKYRIKKSDGTYSGGPMHFLSKGIKNKHIGKFLAVFYCLAAVLSYFGTVSMVDTNTIVNVITEKVGAHPLANGTSLTTVIIAVALVAIVGIIIFGGIKRLGHACELITPVMGIIYIASGLIVIIANIKLLPSALVEIFGSAFTTKAAAGGFAGATVSQIMRYGMARGMYSNEAGLGSAAVTHSSAKVDNPVQQALWAPTDIFLDTMVVNSITGIVIVMSGLWTSGVDGAALTMNAFEALLGSSIGGWMVLISAILFGFTCLISTSYVCEQSAAYLFGTNSKYVVRVLWLIFIVIGAFNEIELVWNIADTVNGFLAIPNIIGLLILSGQVIRMKKDYFASNELKAK